jgi:hypothetical protein
MGMVIMPGIIMATMPPVIGMDEGSAEVDYSGKRVPIVDPLTGEVRMAELFIAVLGASNLTFADASWTQSPSGRCFAPIPTNGLLHLALSLSAPLALCRVKAA